MPKMKTHKSGAKRYKVTGTGKITRRKAGIGAAKCDAFVAEAARPAGRFPASRARRHHRCRRA